MCLAVLVYWSGHQVSSLGEMAETFLWCTIKPMSWITEKSDSVLISVAVVPKSSRNMICGIHGESIKIKIAAPPEGGKANAELIEFLSKLLGINRHSVSIVSGDANRKKIIKLSGITRLEIEKKFNI